MAKNGSEHRRGAVTREKKTRAHQDHIPGSPVLVQSSVLSSIFIVLCHTEVYIWLPSFNNTPMVVIARATCKTLVVCLPYIYENLIPETNVCSNWFLLRTKMLWIWFLGFTAICYQFTGYYLVPMSYWGRLDGLCSKLSSDSLQKKTGYRASEAYPLKDFAGERLGTLC